MAAMRLFRSVEIPGKYYDVSIMNLENALPRFWLEAM